MRSKFIGLNNISKIFSENYSGVNNIDEHYFAQLNDSWETRFGPILGIGGDLESINSALSGFGTADIPSIVSELSNLGYTTVMTPTYNAMAESMSGVTSTISAEGVFRSDVFDNGTIIATDGFDNSLLNGYGYLAFAGFESSTFYGTGVMVYDEYSGNTPLSGLFSPNQDRTLRTFVRDADGTTFEDTTSGTSTIFSNNQQPNTSGYHDLSRFSVDDGSHGFAVGTTGLNGNGGPYLQDATGRAYGCENRNGGDSSADTFYWGTSAFSASNYVFVFFAKFEGGVL